MAIFTKIGPFPFREPLIYVGLVNRQLTIQVVYQHPANALEMDAWEAILECCRISGKDRG